MRDPKEPGDNYNMKEHVYHDSNIVQGLPNEAKVHVKDSKQKITNQSKNSKKKRVYDKPVEQTKLKENPYAEPHAHQTTSETSADTERKQKSKDTSAARSGNSSRGTSAPKASVSTGAPDENSAPKRRELISAPEGIEIESVPTDISFIENETEASPGIQLISKKELGSKTESKNSALIRHKTWRDEDSFDTTRKAVAIKSRKQEPVETTTSDVKHFRRNALIITLFLATILIIVAIVVVCLVALT
ncbi:uncharacterized protein LOC117103074 [Anneissia japonica]|uniref:uncharacterized protein LOC117103074 n=1 Tax=Anneissia japonica TaxID=1529436 RepID=UPI0014257EFB|nr:uncharacterized protein LOC117103074 [Anneissia japonica]